jgi:hypothetical protein
MIVPRTWSAGLATVKCHTAKSAAAIDIAAVGQCDPFRWASTVIAVVADDTAVITHGNSEIGSADTKS